MEDLPTDIATFVDTHLVDRHNSNAVKWDGLKEEFGRADLLPMWIADTEFKAPQAVLDALTARVKGRDVWLFHSPAVLLRSVH
ncbi:hypothetical protein PY99_05955 [Lacticaseibacillus rhamnosus]|nr:hypothetical protein PY99_05955 [Lacticaseibacillus rhamnosus]